MSDMVERVASALHHNEWGEVEDWGGLSVEMRKYWMDSARTAIEAMLDGPITQSMVEAGAALSMEKRVPEIAKLNALAIYRAMIDAAIKENKE